MAFSQGGICSRHHAVFGHDKVSILDGGLPRWIEEGGDVEVGEPTLFKASESLEGPEHPQWVRCE